MEVEFKQAFEHLEKLSRDNYNNLSEKIKDLKNDVSNLYERDRAMYKELIEVRAQAKSTQSELTDFKKDEKEYGKQTHNQLLKLDNMHWKVLTVGIALIGVFITAYKLLIK